MESTVEVARKYINKKIDEIEIEKLIDSSRSCLNDDDLVQSVVRLEEIGKIVKFDDFTFDILESLSIKE